MRILIKELSKMIEERVLLRGWVHDIRLLGKINFLILRDCSGYAQLVIKKENILNQVKKLHNEDVIEVEGVVKKSISEKFDVEVEVEDIRVINKSLSQLPLDPREVTKTNFETKLNWRFLYFRTEEGRAIFRIQTEILNAFRNYFLSKGFIEMQPPIIISSASEGGAELFSLPYFEKKAYLAQSPQLYKQMGAISFEKVFMIVPVFRAEKFDQPTHLNEIRQMDIEMAFANDEDVIKELENVLRYIITEVKEKCKEELKILNRNLEIPKIPLPRVRYEKAVEKLKEIGEKIEYGEDFSKQQERKMVDIFGKAFILKDWPEELKPFYAMPYEENPKIVKAFDLIYEGLEISSGAQRIHLPDLLEKRIKEKGLDPENFKYYIDCFKYGAPPHSGWSIGLERLTMKICGKSNIQEVTMFPRTRTRIQP
ncbi:MAG: aspartate--tRNA(Asn) ligase [Candidatus Aenigmatarchaeota archaeon]